MLRLLFIMLWFPMNPVHVSCLGKTVPYFDFNKGKEESIKLTAEKTDHVFNVN